MPEPSLFVKPRQIAGFEVNEQRARRTAAKLISLRLSSRCKRTGRWDSHWVEIQGQMERLPHLARCSVAAGNIVRAPKRPGTSIDVTDGGEDEAILLLHRFDLVAVVQVYEGILIALFLEPLLKNGLGDSLPRFTWLSAIVVVQYAPAELVNPGKLPGSDAGRG